MAATLGHCGNQYVFVACDLFRRRASHRGERIGDVKFLRFTNGAIICTRGPKFEVMAAANKFMFRVVAGGGVGSGASEWPSRGCASQDGGVENIRAISVTACIRYAIGGGPSTKMAAPALPKPGSEPRRSLRSRIRARRKPPPFRPAYGYRTGWSLKRSAAPGRQSASCEATCSA